MINRAKLQHILEYAKQQRHIGLHCKVPPEDMVEILEMAMLQGAEHVTTAYKLPANTPCKEAPEHIWLQTAGVWPENGEFSELTWCSDNQHTDDTLYVRADVVADNSPVIPDGWVACSELMPEQFKAILAFNEYGEVWSGAYDRYWNFYCDNLLVEHVTHWMPLPAAPQQEVKRWK